VRLGQKADGFCIHYTTLGAETFGRAERSAIAAGFGAKSARNRGTALLKKPEVRERISQLHAQNMRENFLTTAKVLNDLEAVRISAVEANDRMGALRASELQGKHLGMFSDRLIQTFEDAGRQHELDEAELEEAKQLARIRLGLPALVFALPGNSNEIAGKEQGKDDGQQFTGCLRPVSEARRIAGGDAFTPQQYADRLFP